MGSPEVCWSRERSRGAQGLLKKACHRVVETAFDGSNLVSDGDVVLLHQVDKRICRRRAAVSVWSR